MKTTTFTVHTGGRETVHDITGHCEQFAGESSSGGDGLLNAIADGTFGVTKRPPDGGRGLDGVVARADSYFNPVSEILEEGEDS